MKIKVKNYQSIAGTELEVSGLTVIVGRSNIGKSALIRALAAGVFGQPGDHYVRDGESHCGVVIETPNLKLLWRKVPKPTKDKFTVLQLNGTQHTKLGKEHSDLTEPYGFRELKTSSLRVRPQFAMQFDEIFLITDPGGTTAAEVFKLLGRTDVITAAQADAKRDLRDREGKLKVRKEDVITARKQKEELDYVPPLRAKLEAAKQAVSQHEEQAKNRTGHRDRLTRLQQLEPRTVPAYPTVPHPVKIELREKLRRYEELEPKEVPTLPVLQLDPSTKQRYVAMLKEIADIEQTGQSRIEWIAEEIDPLLEILEKKKHDLEHELKICPTCARPFLDLTV